MNDLWQMQSFLAFSMKADTTLALATCAVWLDPALFSAGEFDSGSEEDDLTYALHICREGFTEVYVEAVQALWRGEGWPALNRAICTGLNRHLVTPLRSLEQIRYGVPFEALGVDRDDPDFSTQYPQLVPIAAWFEAEGSDPQETAAVLIQSLAPNGDTGIHADLAHLLGWLFGVTGNTLVDWSEDLLWEQGIDPPDWTPDDIQFLNEVQEEAHQIVASALRALECLEQNQRWAQILQRNLKLVRERKKPDEQPALRWQPDTCHSPSDLPHPDSELLPVRGDPAPSDRGWGDHRVPG